MAGYSVTFARSARKELQKLSPAIAERIVAQIEKLQTVPRPSGALILKGDSGLWRVRISDYRVIYSIDDMGKLVDIAAVQHRKDVYRNL